MNNKIDKCLASTRPENQYTRRQKVTESWKCKSTSQRRQKILNDFESKKFLIKITTHGKGPKTLIPKRILQQLPIAGNISEKLLN